MKQIKSDFLPDYCVRASERSFFTQTMIDVATILAWCLVGMVLAMAAGAPILWAMLLAFGVL